MLESRLSLVGLMENSSSRGKEIMMEQHRSPAMRSDYAHSNNNHVAQRTSPSPVKSELFLIHGTVENCNDCS